MLWNGQFLLLDIFDIILLLLQKTKLFHMLTRNSPCTSFMKKFNFVYVFFLLSIESADVFHMLISTFSQKRLRCKITEYLLQFSHRHSQSRAYALSAASQLPLFIRRRSLSRYEQLKIRASTISRCSHRLAELLQYFLKIKFLACFFCDYGV